MSRTRKTYVAASALSPNILSVYREGPNTLLVDFVLEVTGYATARILLPIIALGNVQVELVSSNETGFNWAGFKRDEKVAFCAKPQWLAGSD